MRIGKLDNDELNELILSKFTKLRDEVVAACADGRFHIYAVKTVDEAINVLTGLPAESINDQVLAQLAELSSARRVFASEHRASPPDQAGKAH